jgi:hypothetical protein
MRNKDGKIITCEMRDCGHTCCGFQHGNYIVLYPGELEEAAAAGQSTTHLQIIDEDYNGGKKAVCMAKNPSVCDGGFKPLDCVSYPLFPARTENGRVDSFIKGKKCPLHEENLQEHLETIRALWNELVNLKPEVAAWIDKVELVGYTEPERRPTTCVLQTLKAA